MTKLIGFFDCFSRSQNYSIWHENWIFLVERVLGQQANRLQSLVPREISKQPRKISSRCCDSFFARSSRKFDDQAKSKHRISSIRGKFMYNL